MHLSSLPYLEPSKLLLYPLNFVPLLYSTMPILHSTLQYFSQLFSLKLNYQGSSLFLLVLPRFLLTLLPTYLLMTPLFIPQNIFCILLCNTCQSFPLDWIIRYFLYITLSSCNYLFIFSKYSCIVLSFIILVGSYI